MLFFGMEVMNKETFVWQLLNKGYENQPQACVITPEMILLLLLLLLLLYNIYKAPI